MPKDPRDMSMAEQLRASLAAFERQSLNDHIDTFVRAKLMTPDEAAHYRATLPAEKLNAPVPVPPRPRRRKRRAAPQPPSEAV